MKCLSVKQPWAWLIVNGFKSIENREWSTKYRGLILIHTGMQFDKYAWDYMKEKFKISIPDGLRLGGIVGQTEIADCVSKSESIWFEGPFGFVLRNSKPLPFVPFKGKLGIFDLENPYANHHG